MPSGPAVVTQLPDLRERETTTRLTVLGALGVAEVDALEALEALEALANGAADALGTGGGEECDCSAPHAAAAVTSKESAAADSGRAVRMGRRAYRRPCSLSAPGHAPPGARMTAWTSGR
ncbi:MAG: hypothetical protein NVSMB47_15220 [Polyangiales bacterium]